MRVYVGATLRDLARLLDERELGPGPLDAHAVTAPLTAALSTDSNAPDAEELEFAATEDAARTSLQRIAALPSSEAQHRRVVVVAEVDDSTVRPDPARGDSGVVVDLPIALRQVRAVHVDDEAADQAVADAVRTIDPDRPNAGPDVDTLDALGEYGLLWYATQEIAALVDRDP